MFASAGIDDGIGEGQLVRQRQICRYERDIGTEGYDETPVSKRDGIERRAFAGFPFYPLVELVLHRGRHQQLCRVAVLYSVAVARGCDCEMGNHIELKTNLCAVLERRFNELKNNENIDGYGDNHIGLLIKSQ